MQVMQDNFAYLFIFSSYFRIPQAQFLRGLMISDTAALCGPAHLGNCFYYAERVLRMGMMLTQMSIRAAAGL